MRRLLMCAPMIILCLLLTACGGQKGGGGMAEQRALELRAQYLESAGCTAAMEVTADYGERIYQYSIGVTYVKDGETVLTVTAPENVAGIVARLTKDSGTLEYDGICLETGSLSPDGMSPVDAVPALLTCAREGFIAECGMEEWDGSQILRILCRNPEEKPGAGREISLWFNPDTGALLRGEIAQDGYTVIQCIFTAFQLT